MRSNLAILLFAVLSNTAMAGWMKFGENARQKAYYDPASVVNEGDIANVSILNDFNEAMRFGNKSALSMVNKFEFDCKKKLFKLNTMLMFSESMGRGKNVYTNDSPAEWGEANTAGTAVDYPSFDLICGKAASKNLNRGWIRFSEGKSQVSYYDPKSIRHNDSKSTVMILNNFSSALLLGDKSALSMINQFEFDCKKHLMRLNTLTLFEEGMGQGEKVLINDNPPNKWGKANAAGTMEYPSIKVVCG